MGVRFVGRIIAPAVEPDTPIPYTYTAGEFIHHKAPVCKGESDNKVYEACASSRTRMPAFGIAQSAAEANTTVKVLQFGFVTDVRRTEDFDYDDKIYVSETQGKLTKIPPETIGVIVQSVGRAVNPSDIILEVDPTTIEILPH